MLPANWLTKNEKSARQFAIDHDLVPATVWKTIKGKLFPSFEMIEAFYRASRGQVAINDWSRLVKASGLKRKRSAGNGSA